MSGAGRAPAHAPVSASSQNRDRPIAVFGASGHTGRFVVAELRRRRWNVILSGRDAVKLSAVAGLHPGSVVRSASVDDPESLDRALSGAAAVINCAGPFVDTCGPVIEAALRAGVPYLDVTAEAAVAARTFARYSDLAGAKGIPVVPAMAFFGGLGDLLATAAMKGWTTADEVCLAFALDSWHPTPGTRETGRRRCGRRLVYSGGRLQERMDADPAPNATWQFPAPYGVQEVVTQLFTPDTVTIPRHLRTSEVRAVMNLAPILDLRNSDTPTPVAADDTGRSAQAFLVEVVVRKGNDERRMIARGRDIYATTAPIVVEAVERILDGRVTTGGVAAAGEIFDAQDFLRVLETEHLSIEGP